MASFMTLYLIAAQYFDLLAQILHKETNMTMADAGFVGPNMLEDYDIAGTGIVGLGAETSK